MRSGARRLGAAALAAALVGVLAPAGPAAATPLDPWWFTALHMADNHRISTGEGATVAIIDTAFDPTVPELKGADVHFGLGCLKPGEKTKPLVSNFNSGHGTAMATIIAGQGTGNAPGGAGVTGMAPDARINLYSLSTHKTMDDLDCSEENTDRILMQAADDGADIVSISLTGLADIGPSIQKLIDRGVVVVAGAGGDRDPYIGAPASFPGVVSVLANDSKGGNWTHNPGSDDTPQRPGYPVVSGPGVKVPVGIMEGNVWHSGENRTGTSDATAMVAGMLALVKSKYPHATGNQLVQQLIHHTGDGSHPYHWDKYFGFGIASATQMLRTDPTKWPDVNPLTEEPEQVLKDFPMSSYGHTTPAASPTPTASATTKKAATVTADDSGIPVWVWVVVAAVLLIAAALLLIRTRAKKSTVLPTVEGNRS